MQPPQRSNFRDRWTKFLCTVGSSVCLGWLWWPGFEEIQHDIRRWRLCLHKTHYSKVYNILKWWQDTKVLKADNRILGRTKAKKSSSFHPHVYSDGRNWVPVLRYSSLSRRILQNQGQSSRSCIWPLPWKTGEQYQIVLSCNCRSCFKWTLSVGADSSCWAVFLGHTGSYCRRWKRWLNLYCFEYFRRDYRRYTHVFFLFSRSDQCINADVDVEEIADIMQKREIQVIRLNFEDSIHVGHLEITRKT